MSIFYLLPSTPQLGEQFASYLSTTFPGLDWPNAAWTKLAETLTEIAAQQPDVFVVYREELPVGEDTRTALGNGFGATAGDEIVEVPSGQRWRIGESTQPV